MPPFRFRSFVAATLVALSCTYGSAVQAKVDFTDIWWAAGGTESGWGANFAQTGDFIFVTFFIYGPSGEPVWYTAQLQRTAGDSFSGGVYVVSGTWFGSSFFPPVPPSGVFLVGDATFTATSSHRGTLRYRIDTVTVNVLGNANVLEACRAAGVKLTSPGPVLFRQERMGVRFRPFLLLKFRSMTHGVAGAQVTSAGDARITPVGRLLRKTKLDELPQLFNVLRGEMSLVGPRPEVRRYVEAFREDYARILEVRPGITDFAAIEYRDEETILARSANPERAYMDEVLPAKIRLYYKYLERRSFSTDLALIFRTLGAILR